MALSKSARRKVDTVVASPDSPLQEHIHFPKDLRYACALGGHCCKSDWLLIADAPAIERVEAVAWRPCSSLPKSVESPFDPGDKRSPATLRKGADGACHFLGPDKLCRLEKRFGHAIKPRACRAHPFKFIRTPSGVYPGLSFTCRSVLANSGPLVQTHEAELRALIEDEEGLCADLPDPVRFDSNISLDWERYLLIEGALDEILARESETVETCLIAGHVWLGILRRMLRLIRSRMAAKKNLPADAPTTDELIAMTIDHYVKQSREQRFEQVFRVAQKPSSQAAIKRMLLGAFISFRDSLSPHQPRLLTIARALVQYARHWFRLGSIRLPLLAGSVPYGEFRPSDDDLADDATQALLRRYFRHTLFRKDLIRNTDVFLGYGYLAMTYGLIQWYAAFLRSAGEPDPARALALVEEHFVFHTEFNQIFLYHPAMADIVQYLFRKPNFAHTMARG